MQNSFCQFFLLPVLYCKRIQTFILFAVAIGFTNIAIAETYYDTVKKVVFSDAYKTLPQYLVKRDLFDKDGRNILLENAKRTLSSERDLVEFPAGQKLLQANGICFAGTWHMSDGSPYTGLYSANTTLPVLVRASVSLSGTKQDDKRAFAIAVKIFPNHSKSDTVKTQNVFLMHSLGGVQTERVLDLQLDNEPELGSLPPFKQWLTAYRLESDLEKADRLFSGDKANARFRPVSHLAELDAHGQRVVDVNAPYWLRATASSSMPPVDEDDFRDELQVRHYPDQQLVWELHGAAFQSTGKSESSWVHLGQIVLTQSIVSKSCDSKLHFAHPTLN